MQNRHLLMPHPIADRCSLRILGIVSILYVTSHVRKRMCELCDAYLYAASLHRRSSLCIFARVH